MFKKRSLRTSYKIQWRTQQAEKGYLAYDQESGNGRPGCGRERMVVAYFLRVGGGR